MWNSIAFVILLHIFVQYNYMVYNAIEIDKHDSVFTSILPWIVFLIFIMIGCFQMNLVGEFNWICFLEMFHQMFRYILLHVLQKMVA